MNTKTIFIELKGEPGSGKYLVLLELQKILSGFPCVISAKNVSHPPVDYTLEVKLNVKVLEDKLGF